jgi:protein arginine kinase
MWTFEVMMSEPSGWLDASGPQSEVVLSTRVRLARNLEDHVFPDRAGDAELGAVREKILDASAKNNYLTNALVVGMEDASLATRQVLVERHLVSAAFATGRSGRAAIVGEREVVSAMVNEEDHLRLQCIRSGLQSLDAWRLAARIDSELDQNLHYAFSGDWGYLTACPTNVGTGMRMSVLAHLVGLVRTKEISQVLRSISKLGLAVRGFYGEGSTALGGFFQISNQTTLGQSEEDIAYTIERVAGQLAGLELRARQSLAKRESRRLSDEVWRAYGTLAHARLISADEVMELSSSLRLGVVLHLIDSIDLATVNRLLVVTQPGHIKYRGGCDATAEEESGLRADFVRGEVSSPGRGGRP